MTLFPVSSQKHKQLQDRMARLGIKESDLEETFIRSGGPGGQNVNKVSTCVVLKHRPSGTVVRCQKERSQAMNRYQARCVLLKKIENEQLGKASAEAQKIAKIRRQKRRRSRRAKLKLLDDKRQHGEKKESRRTFRPHQDFD